MRPSLAFLAPSLSGLLLYLSFHPVNLGPVAWVALVPLIVQVLREERTGRALASAWLGGFLFFSASFFWLRYTGGWGVLILAAYKGLFWLLFAFLLRGLCRRGRWPVPVAAPVAWVAVEYLRAHLFGGLPWFLVAYTQHEVLALIQICDLAGPWTLCFVLLAVNGTVARAFLEPARQRAWSAAAAGLVVASFAYGGIRLATLPMGEGPLVGIVQPNIPQNLKLEMRLDKDEVRRQERKKEIFEKHRRLTKELVRDHPDVQVVFWPETVLYETLFWSRDWNRWLEGPADIDGIPYLELVTSVAREVEKPILLGVQVNEVQGLEVVAFTNSAVLTLPSGGIAGRYDKVHLVPFSERMPFRFLAVPVMRWVLDREIIWEFSPGRGFPILEAGGAQFGTSICAEVVFPEISREIAGTGAPLLVNISNDGWFRDSAELDQMLAMARFRAVENRIPIVRATNTGISAAIDPAGRIQEVVEDPSGRRKEVEGVLAVRVRTGPGPAGYGVLGDALAAICAGAAAAGWALARRTRIDRETKGP